MEITQVLRGGERVLWAGAPARKPPVDWIDVVGGLMMVYVLGFTLLWQVMAASAPAFFRLMGLFPTVGGLAMITVVLLRRRRTNVSYTVTNERIMVHAGGGTDTIAVRELAPAQVFARRVDGTGSISFGPPNKLGQAAITVLRGPGSTHPRMHLIQVPRADDVAEIIRSAQRGDAG